MKMLEPVWVGSKMPGKPWNGFSAPMCVLHTLEFSGFPQTWKWDSPSHYVYNPLTQELRQYVSTTKAAYSLRHNRLEDDHFTLQVEMFGKAGSMPFYSDQYYEGVAALVSYVNVKYGVPLHFADFSSMKAGENAAQRMTATESQMFSGFMGHGHFGKGVDAHWDPGMLDVERVKSFLVTGVEEEMPRILFEGMIDALFDADQEFQGDADFWKKLIDKPNDPQWDNDFWPAFTRMVTAG